MKRKKIILSYDYELFFGDRSGTVQKSLIEPTNLLLDSMDRVGFKGNFFIDWQMIKYLSLEKDEQCRHDYASVVNQLKDIVRRGHRIELHIHPHWVDAKYNGDGTWNFSEYRHYCLNSFPPNEITDMFVEGTNLLESIAREVIPDYKIVAFRAGGWAVQPFRLLIKGFQKTGIRIDSSVISGLGVISQHASIDYTAIKNPSCGFYKFKDNESIEDKGEFIEVPISTCKRTFPVKIVSLLSRLIKCDVKAITDGTHSRTADPEEQWLNPHHLGVFTFSNITPLETFLRQVTNNDRDVICYIEHPKDYSKYTARNIRALSCTRCDSINYKDILDQL